MKYLYQAYIPYLSDGKEFNRLPRISRLNWSFLGMGISCNPSKRSNWIGRIRLPA